MSWTDRVLFNTRERLVSTDLNALQARTSRAFAEVLRGLHGYNQLSFWDHPGESILVSSTPSGGPLPCDVFSGLQVLPGSTTCSVSSGACAFAASWMPGLDESGYVYCDQVDQVTPPELNWYANGTGGAVWRYIEARPVDVPSSVESRDIFNRITKLFYPANVTKRSRATLQYRVRDSGGAYLPSNDIAWTPIAAVHVNASATGWDACDFYDVRPLVSERVLGFSRTPGDLVPGVGSGVSVPWARTRQANYCAKVANGVLNGVIQGHAIVEGIGYWAGGRIVETVPATSVGTLLEYVTFSAKNCANGLPNTNGAVYGIYAVFPGGLPRWAYYEPSGGRRIIGPRGLLVTDVLPTTDATNGDMTGIKSISMPPSAHISGAQPGVMIATVTTRRTGEFSLGACAGAGKSFSSNSDSGPGTAFVATTVAAQTKLHVSILRNAYFPARATKIRLRLLVELVAISGGVGALVDPIRGVPVSLLLRAGMSPTVASNNGVWENEDSHYFEQALTADVVPYHGTTFLQLIELTTDWIPVVCDQYSGQDSYLNLGIAIVDTLNGATSSHQFTGDGATFRVVGWEE